MIHENDDIHYALRCNLPTTFKPDDIQDIIAEVPGENDELNWWWILKLGKGKYALVSGWCVFTGWDCQSGIDELGIFTTPRQAAKAAPDIEEASNRAIRKNLLGQISGKYPKFTYWSE